VDSNALKLKDRKKRRKRGKAVLLKKKHLRTIWFLREFLGEIPTGTGAGKRVKAPKGTSKEEIQWVQNEVLKVGKGEKAESTRVKWG